MIDASGEVRGISKMVHIAQAEHFYEQDYYTPSDDGFRVYDTPFGTIGIVIISGVAFSTLLSLFVVPAFYALLAPYTRSPEAVARKLEKLEAEVPHVGGHA